MVRWAPDVGWPLSMTSAVTCNGGFDRNWAPNCSRRTIVRTVTAVYRRSAGGLRRAATRRITTRRITTRRSARGVEPAWSAPTPADPAALAGAATHLSG